MNKLTATSVFIITAAGAYAQGGPATSGETNMVFQYSFQSAQASDQMARTGPTRTFYFAAPGTVTTFGMEALGGKVVTGKPFVGTEERHSLQVLGDGTRIETSDTDKIYRDEQGRTRVERDGGKFVTIQDPVSGTTFELDTTARTFRKSQVRTSIQVRSSASGNVSYVAVDQLKKQAAESLAAAGGVTVARLSETEASGQAAAMADELKKKLLAETAAAGSSDKISLKAENAVPKVDLGTQMVNGVMAQGSRTTLTIPVGQIGNDRAIRVVGEQWYSNDLQMMVKSSNTDPRFGDTTYQLTGITQVSPDPSLFQAPADYSPAR
jgi:hypothetical protein